MLGKDVELQPEEEIEAQEEFNLEEQDYDSLKRKVETLFAQKKHWREKAKAFEAEKQKLEDELKRREPSLKADNDESESSPEQKFDIGLVETKVDLRLSGFSPEEIRYMEAYAKGKGISLAEASKDPFVIAGVEKLREKQRSVDATPSPSSSGGLSFRGKSFAEMSREERKEAFEATKDKYSLGR